MTATLTRTPRSHVVARVDVLDQAVRAAGFSSRTAFAVSIQGKPGTPRRATTLNLWHGHTLSIEKAEALAEQLGKPVGDLFTLSNGRGIR